jgi:hypothetical protein
MDARGRDDRRSAGCDRGPERQTGHGGVGLLAALLLLRHVERGEVRSVLRQKQVTSETISMAICAYVLLGLTWGLLYIVMFEHQPGAFNFGESRTVSSLSDEQEYFPLLIYFSLATLTTLGYGDITPVTLQTRYTAVAEGIVGQLYLAILVARLVGMRLMRRSVDPGGRPPLAAGRSEGPVRSVLRVPRRRGSRVRSRRTRA